MTENFYALLASHGSGPHGRRRPRVETPAGERRPYCEPRPRNRALRWADSPPLGLRARRRGRHCRWRKSPEALMLYLGGAARRASSTCR
ncbi:MAG: hypothetical protein MZV65_19235 [Chromatiales bacterium]|nr:hypothetical protein [Chromatiales bacterium]